MSSEICSVMGSEMFVETPSEIGSDTCMGIDLKTDGGINFKVLADVDLEVDNKINCVVNPYDLMYPE